MSRPIVYALWLSMALHAQSGQSRPPPGWPCVPGRAIDPAYIETSESTGGQLFLFQKSEIAQSAVVMSAPHTHPATIFRALGQLNGEREFEFPVDASVTSVLVMVSLQCRNTIRMLRPTGSEITAMNSPQDVELQAGRIVRVDQPEPGPWKLRLNGRGLFVLSVMAKTSLSLTSVVFTEATHDVQVRIAGEASGVRVRIVDAAGDPLPAATPVQPAADEPYRAQIVPRTERFRIQVTGLDPSATPFQRTWPVLFRARPQ